MGGKASKTSSFPSKAKLAWLAHVPLVILLVVAAFVMASLMGFDPADPPTNVHWPANEKVTNWCGPAGAWIAFHAFRLLGFGVWVLAVALGVSLLSAAMGQNVRHPAVRALGLIMLAAAAAGFQNLLFPNSGSIPDMAGGWVGVKAVGELSARFGAVGAGMWLLACGVIGLLAAMDDWLLWLVGWTWRRAAPVAADASIAAGKATMPVLVKVGGAAGTATVRAGGGLMFGLSSLFRGREPVAVDLSRPASRLQRGATDADAQRLTELKIKDPDAESLGPPKEDDEAVKPSKRAKAPEPEPAEDAEDQAEDAEDIEDEARLVVDEDEEAEEETVIVRKKKPEPAQAVAPEDDDDDDLPGAPQVFDADKLREKIAKLPVVFGQQNKSVATEQDLVALRQPAEGEAAPYVFPPIDLLGEPEANYSEFLESYVREQATALEAALRQYRIDGEVVGIESGPVITLYDVRLAPGTKVAAITAVESDIARALKAVNIRVVPNQAGRDTVGVEVPNATKEKVRLKELMSRPERFEKMKLPMFLGKDASGEPLIADLTRMPHMLIAGTTGSGKSVCMNTIIMGFLYTRKPTELKLVLVDPKMVEMSQFKDIPHLMCPVVTEMGKAAAILEWACGKMDERYELLAEAGCRDIAGYNELPWEELKERFKPSTPEEESRIPRKLPYMVFVIDELADLMMTNKEVESHIIRIAQKARAVGIHLILATQRPQANVVTGLIKSNMPCRVCFKVNSGMDSRIVMDQKGGELLLGQGDMLFLNPGSSKVSRSQGTLVDDKEIRGVVKFLRDRCGAGQSYDKQLLTLRKAGEEQAALPDSRNNSGAALAAAQEDPLFERAVEIVLETRRGSVSLLQRRLAIGYTRSSRLIDLMGIAGIIGEHKGSVARDVVVTPEEWGEMKRLATEEAKAKGIEYPKQVRSVSETEQSELFSGQPGETPETDQESDQDEELEDEDPAEPDDEQEGSPLRRAS